MNLACGRVTDMKLRTASGEAALKLLKDKLIELDWEFKFDNYAKDFSGVEFRQGISRPKASVVIITYRYLPVIAENLRLLEKQKQEADFEIILVNNGMPADEAESLAQTSDKAVHLTGNTGAYVARNFGALFASAPVLIFLDDDGLPEPGFVSGHLRAHEEFDIVSARGVVKPKTESAFNAFAGHYDFGPDPFPRFVDLEGNASYKAETFYRLGGWNDAIRFGHGGVELAYRISKITPVAGKQAYVPWPVILHDYARDEGHLIAKRKKQDMSRRYLETMHPDIHEYLSIWEQLKGKSDLLTRKETGEKRRDDPASILNLAEFYRRRGQDEKAREYLMKYQVMKLDKAGQS